jgi:hypothetical protein
MPGRQFGVWDSPISPYCASAKELAVRKGVAVVIAAVLIIALGIALALPRTHFALLGWYRGEAYFDGHEAFEVRIQAANALDSTWVI